MAMITSLLTTVNSPEKDGFMPGYPSDKPTVPLDKVSHKNRL
jgi:hypothetical protein